MVQLRQLDVGFNPSGLISIEMSMPSEDILIPSGGPLLARALHQVTELPGVIAGAASPSVH
jgi:hypothetical protein